MRITWNLSAVSLALLAGCSKEPTVEFRILPKSYQVGAVKSELATPAVDEVIRVKAKRVLVLTCTTTPPAKVIQFRVELLARAQPKMELSFLKEGCSE
jgi:hypothetical protein